MSDDEFIKISREFLYTEIWDISVTGVAKKYNAPYAELLRICKDVDIPIPPSGYWTKLSFGKPVEQIPLPESQLNEVILPTNIPQKRTKGNKKSEPEGEEKIDINQAEGNDKEYETIVENRVQEEESRTETLDGNQSTQLAYRIVSGERNIYNREKLYEEVWTKPVVEVALQYGVSDVAIHKICKSLNVPAPPRGYWAKLRAGEKVEKIPLPDTKGIIEKTGSKTFEGIKEFDTPQQLLAFLAEDERQKVLLAAQQIEISEENRKLHKKIIAYNSVVKEWNKKDSRPEGAQKSFKNYTNRPPFLAGVISNDTLPRVYRILDALYRQIESLGGSVNDDLSLQIRNERVSLEVFEAQDEVKHELTRQEAQAVLIFEDAKRHNKWASQPNIRKYDYVFNGKLRISIRQSRYFRDSDKVNIESRLGDMLIELFEESETVRIDREAREEAQRKRKEEERLREERRIRYNDEIDKTIALANIA